MAFSFAELLKKQFPLAGVEAYTGSPKRMPESSPFPSESALGAFGMGGALDALSGVSMADYFNNDNWETRQVEGVSKRGEMVDRQYRMRPGDKTTTEIDKNGNEVITEKRVSPLNTSAQTFPLGEGAVGDRTAIFRNEFEGGRMPTNTVYPRPTTRSMYNRPNEYDRVASMPTSFDGPGIRAQPVQQGMQDEIGRIMMSNDIDEMIPSRSRMPTNTVYPRPTTRSMYNRPVNSPDFMGGQGSVGNTGYSGTYGVPMYGQARPTSAQTYPSNPLLPLTTPTLIENQFSDIDTIGMDDEERRRMMDMLVGLMLERSD